MRKTCIKLLLLLLPAVSLAQQSHNDSLKNALKTARTDAARYDILLNLAVFNEEINRDTALYYYDQSVLVAKKNNQHIAEAVGLRGKGYMFHALGRFPESLAYFQQALKLAEDPAAENHTWDPFGYQSPHKIRLTALAVIHLNLGDLMADAGDLRQALFEHKLGKQLAEGSGQRWVLGLSYMNLGYNYIQLNQPDSALIMHQNAERIFNQTGYKKYLGFVYQQIGGIYLKKGNKGLALQYFHKALRTDLEQKNLSGVAFCYSDLTGYYLSAKQKDSSLYYAKKTLEVLHFMASTQHLDQAYDFLYQSYKLNGKTDSAYKYQGLALTAKDSVFNATTKSLTDFQKLSFKAQIHAQELEKEKEAIQTKIRTYVLLAGILILLLIAGIFYRNNRQKQKANVLLSRQKEEIEAQAREAQIEAALERVRSRTMAMQKSEELAEVIQVMFDQFVALNFNISAANFDNDFGTGNDSNIWVASSNRSYPARVLIPYLDHPVFNIAIEAKQSGADHAICKLTTDETKQFWGHFFKKASPLPEFPPEIHDRIYNSPGYYSYTAIIKSVSLTIVNYSGYAYSESEEAVIMRFGKVFEQTYTRFNDLDQAEAQAHEAKIEAALERVRGRTMGMQKSEELREVIQVVFEQLVHLGIDIFGAGFTMDYKESDDWHIWAADATNSFPTLTHIPHFDHPYWDSWNDAKRKGLDSFAYTMAFEEKNSFSAQFGKYLPDVSSEVIDLVYNTPGYTVSNVLLKNVSLYVFKFTTEPYSDEDNAVLMRFGKVFEQTYTRFKDLEQAEAQARESQIQLGLERVRARTMAMQKSEELKEVIQVVFDQLYQLNFNIDSASFDLNFRESDDMNLWIAVHGAEYATQIYVPFFDHPLFKAYNENKVKGQGLYTPTANYEEKNSFYKRFFEYTPGISEDRKQLVFNGAGYANTFVYMKNIVLSVANYAGIPYSDPDNEIIKRFAAVFEQTYTRFNDLKQAEEQAREAKIEAALERVRSRTMAMFKSDELAETASVLFQQFEALGISLDRIFIGTFLEETHEIECWVTDQGGNRISSRFIGSLNNLEFDKMFTAFKAGKKSLTIVQTGKQLGDYIHYLRDELGLGFKPELLREKRVQNLGFFSKGVIGVSTDEEQPPEMISLVERFAGVFNLTYTRFLDLQKAEAQAREAQIEASLERVRSKTMAMHNSQDVGDTIVAMFSEFVKLGIETLRCGILIGDSSNEMEVWTAKSNPDGVATLTIGRLDMTMHPLLQGLNSAWKNKDSTFEYKMAGDDLKDYYYAINNSNYYPVQFDIESLPAKQVHTDFFFADGAVFAFTDDVIAVSAIEIFKRFAGVFGQTYRRYLDLRRAESQAREAQIEASLERVRSKAMAMRNSGDLSAAASTVFTELRNLGINPIRSGVGLINGESRKARIYSNTATQTAADLALMGEVALAGNPVFEQQYQSWLKQENYFVALGGKELASYYKILSVGLNADLGITVKNNQKEYGHWFMFSEGFLYAWSDKEYSDAEMKILERFKNVIELTFRRYIELQKSETQAREAIRQASLDRVRAEIASMRTISDLDRITPLIWNELTILGVPFIRCGVFIMDEPAQLIHTYLSTPDGKAIAAFQLHYHADTGTGVNVAALRGWREKQVVTLHWTEEEFRAFSHSLVEQGELATEEGYLTERPPTGLDLHFFPFLQGMLYAGNTEPLSDDDKDLVQSLADAFSTAYARYEDFNRLELAKQEVERTLTDLKAAQTRLIQSEKMASLGELTAGIAHEIQNPLNFVNNFSEVNQEMIDELEEELNAGNIEEALAIAADIRQNEQKINHHGKRADGIVKGMLQHSRTAGGEKQPTNINAVAEEYMRLSYHGLRAKDKGFNAEMVMHFDPDLPRVLAVGQDIGRVLLNLFNNAFYAVNQKKKTAGADYKPEVSVTTTTPPPKGGAEAIVIIVRDNGVGMPEQVKEKIMQPFFTTKPTGEGTGLGLSLTYDMVVKGHGGSIQVNSVEGEGTEFIILLPVN